MWIEKIMNGIIADNKKLILLHCRLVRKGAKLFFKMAATNIVLPKTASFKSKYYLTSSPSACLGRWASSLAKGQTQIDHEKTFFDHRTFKWTIRSFWL